MLRGGSWWRFGGECWGVDCVQWGWRWLCPDAFVSGGGVAVGADCVRMCPLGGMCPCRELGRTDSDAFLGVTLSIRVYVGEPLYGLNFSSSCFREKMCPDVSALLVRVRTVSVLCRFEVVSVMCPVAWMCPGALKAVVVCGWLRVCMCGGIVDE